MVSWKLPFVASRLWQGDEAPLRPPTPPSEPSPSRLVRERPWDNELRNNIEDMATHVRRMDAREDSSQYPGSYGDNKVRSG